MEAHPNSLRQSVPLRLRFSLTRAVPPWRFNPRSGGIRAEAQPLLCDSMEFNLPLQAALARTPAPMTMQASSGNRLRLAVLFAVPVAFSLLFFFVNTAAEHNDVRLNRLQSLNAGIGNLRSVANEAEVGEHGFLLTGDERYLVTLEAANSRLTSYVALLSTGREGSLSSVQPQIERIVRLVKDRLAEANKVVETQRSGGFSRALELAKSGHSEQTMQEIRDSVEALQKELSNRIGADLEQERNLTRFAFLFFLFGTLTMLIVLVWLYNSFLSYMQARDAAHMQLQVLNADLEERIGERTKELRQFNEELQQFAYVASHDLQEPLRTITSFTQLLANRYKGHLDEEADEFIGYIVSSSRRMSDLINGLLAMVRLRKSGQSAPVSFDELLRQAEMSLQASIRESQAIVESDALPALVVDPIQFSQVLQNLISNAIKYRREESPRIKVSAQRDASNWIFSVTDNGRGFEQQFAERIFGLFQRLHAREVEGTGMGLSIARKVVERHGGRMWAESTEGVGSTFYFSLPVSLEAHSSESAETAEVASEAR